MAYRILSALLLVALMTKAADAAAGDLNAACNAGACTSADHICDTNRATPLCKAKETKTCAVDDDCVAGSTCSGSACLGCTAALSSSSAGLCNPSANYVGGTCTSGSCVDAHAACSTSKCACSNNYAVKYSTYSCVPNLGTACTETDGCSDTANHVCDPVAKVCKIRATISCSGNTDSCMTGATCATNLCTCSAQYTLSGTTCKPNLGTACSPTSSVSCEGADNKCDPYSNTCKIKSGGTCVAGETKCTTGATCTTSGGSSTCVCDTATTVADATNLFCQKMISAGVACMWYDKCNDANTVCDLQLGKCAKTRSADCKASDTCVSGSTCTSATCGCATGFSSSGSFCVAASGKPGGPCSSGACTDTNAECKTTPAYGSSASSACYCKTNFNINPTDGKCTASSAASSLSKMTGFVTVLAALYLGLHM